MHNFTYKLSDDLIERLKWYMAENRISYTRLSAMVGLSYKTFRKAFIDREPVTVVTNNAFEYFAKTHNICSVGEEEIE